MVEKHVLRAWCGTRRWLLGRLAQHILISARSLCETAVDNERLAFAADNPLRGSCGAADPCSLHVALPPTGWLLSVISIDSLQGQRTRGWSPWPRRIVFCFHKMTVLFERPCYLLFWQKKVAKFCVLICKGSSAWPLRTDNCVNAGMR